MSAITKQPQESIVESHIVQTFWGICSLLKRFLSNWLIHFISHNNAEIKPAKKISSRCDSSVMSSLLAQSADSTQPFETKRYDNMEESFLNLIFFATSATHLRNEVSAGRSYDIINGGKIAYYAPNIAEKTHLRQAHPSIIICPYAKWHCGSFCQSHVPVIGTCWIKWTTRCHSGVKTKMTYVNFYVWFSMHYGIFRSALTIWFTCSVNSSIEPLFSMTKCAFCFFSYRRRSCYIQARWHWVRFMYL